MNELPAYIDPAAWEGFCSMRKSMGKSKPFTERAQMLILKRLAEIHAAGHDVNAALDQSTVHAWAGVWPAKQEQLEQVRRSEAERTAEYLQREEQHVKALRSVR